MPVIAEVRSDYATAGLSLKRHPVALVRDQLKSRQIISSAELSDSPHGRWVKVAGVVLVRQRPATASGIVFETLEDESGVVNLIIKPDVYERYRLAARHATFVQAEGRVEREGQVVHVMAYRLADLNELMAECDMRSRDFH